MTETDRKLSNSYECNGTLATDLSALDLSRTINQKYLSRTSPIHLEAALHLLAISFTHGREPLVDFSQNFASQRYCAFV